MARDIDQYRQDYVSHYGFEEILVGYRRRVVLDRLRALKPGVVLEIGCGPDLLYAHYLEGSKPADQWLVVEPNAAWCDQARAASLPGLFVIQGFLEESLAQVRSALARCPDVVICSGVLHEVPSAPAMLASIRGLMDSKSLLHVNVPNAESFHRRLALAMNLIPTLKTFSELNLLMQQHRVYDLASLEKDLADAQFRVVHKGGYLVKPFTHEQMDGVVPLLGREVLDGLFQLGLRYPEWACEIFVEARCS